VKEVSVVGGKFTVHSENFTAVTRGKTVQVLDKATGQEMAKFNDLKYAYRASFNLSRPILAVKSTQPWLAFYSMETMSLIRKIRIKTLSGELNNNAQDGGFCFSSDGRHFLNLETVNFSTHLVVYDCDAFEETQRYFAEDSYNFNTIERHGDGYLLAFFVAGVGGTLYFFDGQIVTKVRNLAAHESIDAYSDVHY